MPNGMAGKRKRSHPASESSKAQKRPKIADASHGKTPNVKHMLVQYYPSVLSLRDYLLLKLPPASKVRRKKIASVGRLLDRASSTHDSVLANFLDIVLVGVSKCAEIPQEQRLKDWTAFSQRGDISVSTFANSSSAGGFSLSEIVDFTIWSLFSRSCGSLQRTQHLLCQGYRKDVTSRAVQRHEKFATNIPSLMSTHPNSHVTDLKTGLWPQVLSLLGRAGESVMIDLLLDCGIFLPIADSHGNFSQLSGYPLSDLQVLGQPGSRKHPCYPPIKDDSTKEFHSPASISFVRNRMLYARPATNSQGRVQFGLRHIHVLNRCGYEKSSASDSPRGAEVQTSDPFQNQNNIRVMMYIFPRQFGLHNVFTSAIDKKETAQPFKDYTLREDEINSKYRSSKNFKIPKRLRGRAKDLVEKLQARHKRCSYSKLLDYYCSASGKLCSMNLSMNHEQKSLTVSTMFDTQDVGSIKPARLTPPEGAPSAPRKASMMDHATPTAKVSAFCRAVLSNIVPRGFWGSGDVQKHNEQVFLRNVHRFVTLRRFESLTLHEVSQGIKIVEIDWLAPSSPQNVKLSQSDFSKRREVFLEFLYYLFDSILIPLIRANFHVTESNIHRYRLFFYRHDVWKSLAEPLVASLKTKMFEEIPVEHATRILDSRALGFSQVRLLPKDYGVRPIMNLRRRAMQKGNKKILGSSINSVLAPVYNMLIQEKTQNPDRLGATLFSPGDLYQRLKPFKSKHVDSSRPFYFAKVDVQAAFDTIPQAAVIKLVSALPFATQYLISKYVEIKAGGGHREEGQMMSKPLKKWRSLAQPTCQVDVDSRLQQHLVAGKKNTVFVESIVNKIRDTDELISLLSSHIQLNIVKFGKKFYRQKKGIPQGSVISSLLCNFFYANLESMHLDFLSSPDSLLLRLTDDFLLVTTNRSHARTFLQTMHAGLPAYGVTVNSAKTLVNFEVVIKGKKVARVVGSRGFPYCGSFIDTKNLDISRDREHRKAKDLAITDSLTVEFSKIPGKMFHRKVLNSFKLQCHPMYYDTTHNSLSTVLSNLSSAFTETALKAWSYYRSLPSNRKPQPKLVIKTLRDLTEMAFVLIKSEGRNRTGETKEGDEGYGNRISKAQLERLALEAFREALGRRQSAFREVLGWVNQRLEDCRRKL